MSSNAPPLVRPLLVVISGPSGSGKTTVAKRLAEKNGYVLSVSATTRLPRPDECDGRDYRFLAREEFETRVGRGEFLEHSEHFGHFYGTPRGPVEQALRQGKVVVLEIDVNGARQVKEQLAGSTRLLRLFINTPSRGELRTRILHRPGTGDEAFVRQRLARADLELQEAHQFHAVIINDTVERAVAEIEQLIQKEAAIPHG